MTLTLEQFQQRFNNEEACRSFLIQTRWPNGFCCPRCGHDEHYYIRTRELYECCECRAQTSVTAGTIMHRTKLPLQFWFLTIYLVACRERCSANWLADTLQLNYRTAMRMLRAVRHAMRKQNGPHPLSNILETDNNLLDSSLVTAETGEIPVSTLDLFLDETPVVTLDLASDETPVVTLDSASDETPHEAVARDTDFIGDHIRDTVSPKQAADNCANPCWTKPDAVTRAKQFMIGKIKQYTRLTYRSIQRKYLQSYVDEHYFRWTERFNADRLFFVLLRASVSATPYQSA